MHLEQFPKVTPPKTPCLQGLQQILHFLFDTPPTIPWIHFAGAKIFSYNHCPDDKKGSHSISIINSVNIL